MDVEIVGLTDIERRQIRAARFLNKLKPQKYRLERDSFMEGMYLSERLVEDSGEELTPWITVNRLGVDLVES